MSLGAGGHGIKLVAPYSDRHHCGWRSRRRRDHTGPGRHSRVPRATLASVAVPATPAAPPHPLLPANSRGTGRWIVSDLGINVPFSWQGRNGSSQLIAGCPQYRIWFTNLIYGNTLYTVTYKWPLGDIYVDQKDPSLWWQGLQFGLQNLYDPQLDEWFTMTTFSHRPGTVTLPPTCPPPAP